jgi:hypothetical protein
MADSLRTRFRRRTAATNAEPKGSRVENWRSRSFSELRESIGVAGCGLGLPGRISPEFLMLWSELSRESEQNEPLPRSQYRLAFFQAPDFLLRC